MWAPQLEILLNSTWQIQHFLNQIKLCLCYACDILPVDTYVVLMLLLWSYPSNKDCCCGVLLSDRARQYLANTLSLNEKQERIRHCGLYNTYSRIIIIFLSSSFRNSESTRIWRRLWELQSNELILSSLLHKWSGIIFASVIY